MPKIFSPWWAEFFENCFISLCLITLRKSIQKIMPNTLLSNRQFQVQSNLEAFSGYSHTGSPCQPIHFLFPTLQVFLVAVQGKGNVAEKCFSEVPENWYGWHLNIHFCVWGFSVVFILAPAIFGSKLSHSSSIKRTHYNRSPLWNMVIPEKKTPKIWEVGKICPKTKHATQWFY